MNKIISLSAFSSSVISFFALSSNSPLNFDPATSIPKSSAFTFLFLSISGTLFVAILCASPSTIAVLPTPGSPIKTGLFFLRLERISIILVISSALPTTGSILSCIAISVRSLEYLSSSGV